MGKRCACRNGCQTIKVKPSIEETEPVSVLSFSSLSKCAETVKLINFPPPLIFSERLNVSSSSESRTLIDSETKSDVRKTALNVISLGNSLILP